MTFVYRNCRNFYSSVLAGHPVRAGLTQAKSIHFIISTPVLMVSSVFTELPAQETCLFI